VASQSNVSELSMTKHKALLFLIFSVTATFVGGRGGEGDCLGQYNVGFTFFPPEFLKNCLCSSKCFASYARVALRNRCLTAVIVPLEKTGMYRYV